jgi:hypothetical protein
MRSARSALRVLALAASVAALTPAAPAGVPNPFPASPDTGSDSSLASPDSVRPVNTTKLIMVGGAVTGAMIGIHLYQENGWWKYNRAPFHFTEDLTYSLGVDKIGHFYGTTVWAFGLKKLLGWADLPERQALFLGSAGALLFQTFLEVEDGFSAWGFDRVDFASDVAGALWPVARYYSPFLREIDIKLSYRPSEILNTAAGAGFVGQKHLVVDDYEGQTYWLSVPPANMLPGAAGEIWPGFLDVAVGYGVRNVSGVGGEPHPVVFISLDYDVRKIIPQTSAFLVTLSEALNFIHFPAPAIQVSPDYVFYGLYF